LDPLVVAVQVVDDLAPSADGRQWTPDQYRQRDAVLAALGVSTFGNRK
jgi:hypothetical protein